MTTVLDARDGRRVDTGTRRIARQRASIVMQRLGEVERELAVMNQRVAGGTIDAAKFAVYDRWLTTLIEAIGDEAFHLRQDGARAPWRREAGR